MEVDRPPEELESSAAAAASVGGEPSISAAPGVEGEAEETGPTSSSEGPTIPSDDGDARHTANHLSAAQRRAVDAAFERLFGYPWGTTFALPPSLTPEQRLLVRLLGPEAASKVRLRSASGGSLGRRRSAALLARSPSVHPPRTVTKAPTSVPPPSSVPASSSSVPSSSAPQPPSQPHSPAAPVATTLDKVLADLSGSKSGPTTISKTSADWEAFKDASGLGSTIEARAQGKDAFLHRQDFLTRVDARKFEHEKSERDRERAKRGK